MTPVEVELDNRYAYVASNCELYSELRAFWSYSVPGAMFMPKVKEGLWDGRIRFLSRGRLPSGLFRATYEEAAEKLGVTFRISRHLIDEQFLPAPKITDPKYLFQRDCVDAMCKAATEGGGLIICATASGKTAMAGQLMYRMHERTFLFVVDQLNLLYQAQKDLEEYLQCRVGVVGDSKYDPARVTVATIQTLALHARKKPFAAWMRSIDVLIIDEIHEQLAKREFKVLDICEPLASFGLTATLGLSKKEIRYRAFALTGPVIFRYSVEQGTSDEVLNRGSVLQLVFEPVDYKTADRFDEYDVQVVENDVKHEAARLITEYLIDRDRYVVQLVERIAHLETLAGKMLDTKHAIMFGRVKKEDREEAIDDFENGNIHLLIANKVMKKGISIKRMDAIIDMAEMKSSEDAVQKFGRGLRLHDEKQDLFYVEFSTMAHKVKRGWKVKTDELSRAGKSRARAFRKESIPIRRVKVRSAAEALKAVKLMLKKLEAK